jgi:hypothetical protein
MKNIYPRASRVFHLFILFFVIPAGLFAQTYDIYIANRSLTSATTLEFDVYIKSNGSTGNWAIRTYQSGYKFSAAFVNGGSLTCAYVSGSSEMESSFGKTWGFSYNATYKVLNQSANTGTSCPGGLVSTTAKKIGRYRVTNTASWGCADDSLSFVTTGTGILKLSVSKYDALDCSILTVSDVTAGANPYTVSPNPMLLSALATPASSSVTCGASANITVSASGGLAPYSGTGTFSRTAGSWTFPISDARGCSTSVSALVSTIPDTIKPVIIQCPASQTTTANALGTALVPNFLTTLTASDNCTASGNLIISQSPAAGTSAGVGTTNIIITVKDSSNNQSTCNTSFTVNAACVLTAGEISGPTNSCLYQGVTTLSATYSVLATNASSYSWTVPANTTIISGQGTNSLTVHYASAFAGGTISVTIGSTTCIGSPLTKSISITKGAAPATPASISGPVNVCPYLGNSVQATYTSAVVAGAAYYSWTLPQYVTRVSASADSSSITVTFASAFSTLNANSKILSVRAVSGCGTSAARTLSLTTTVPSAPGAISGPANTCLIMNGSFTTGKDTTYFIRRVANATSYVWTVPTGSSIISRPGTGANDTLIVVRFSSTFTSGTLSVRAVNGCGTSTTVSLSLTKTLPSTPGTITTTTVLNACPTRIFRYSITALPAGARSIRWTVPAGAIIDSGQGGLRIRVSYPAKGTAYSGSVTVAGVNTCGTGTAKSTSVKITACALARMGEAIESDIMVEVYPNPTSNYFRLKAHSEIFNQIHIRVIDVHGKQLKKMSMMPGESIDIGLDLRPGIYIIESRQGHRVKIDKVIKI